MSKVRDYVIKRGALYFKGPGVEVLPWANRKADAYGFPNPADAALAIEKLPSGCEVVPRYYNGFAAVSPDKLREISSRGGKSCQAQGKAHRFTPEEAKEVGRKGGIASHVRQRDQKVSP